MQHLLLMGHNTVGSISCFCLTRHLQEDIIHTSWHPAQRTYRCNNLSRNSIHPVLVVLTVCVTFTWIWSQTETCHASNYILLTMNITALWDVMCYAVQWKGATFHKNILLPSSGRQQVPAKYQYLSAVAEAGRSLTTFLSTVTLSWHF